MGVKMLPIIFIVAGMIEVRAEFTGHAPTHPSEYTNRVQGPSAVTVFGASTNVCEPRPDGIGRVAVTFLTPCRLDDIPCLSNTTKEFISNTHKGIPQYDIRPIDPQTIDSTKIIIPDMGLILHMRNLRITGLKNITFSDLKMDTNKKEVVLTTDANINVAGDLTIENVIRKNTQFYGPFTLEGKVSSTAEYNFNLTTECDTNVVHYKIGQETITCRVLNESEYRFKAEFRTGLSVDPIIKKISNKSLRAIAEKAYIPVIHNIRAVAKIIPASSFLIIV